MTTDYIGDGSPSTLAANLRQWSEYVPSHARPLLVAAADALAAPVMPLKYELHLPDGDSRTARVVFSERKGNTVELCVALSDTAPVAPALGQLPRPAALDDHSVSPTAGQYSAEQMHEFRADGIAAALAAPVAPADPLTVIDYDKLIADAWSTKKYRQGTHACVAFKNGAEWAVREYVGAPGGAPAAMKKVTFLRASGEGHITISAAEDPTKHVDSSLITKIEYLDAPVAPAKMTLAERVAAVDGGIADAKAAHAARALVPLTDEQIEACLGEADKASAQMRRTHWNVHFTRAIEAAHGIKP